jgi:hypothetical protein
VRDDQRLQDSSVETQNIVMLRLIILEIFNDGSHQDVAVGIGS